MVSVQGAVLSGLSGICLNKVDLARLEACLTKKLRAMLLGKACRRDEGKDHVTAMTKEKCGGSGRCAGQDGVAGATATMVSAAGE